LLKEALQETTRQAILNDCFLDEECKTEILQAMDEEEISTTEHGDNPVTLKKKLKPKIGCLVPFRGSKAPLKKHDYHKTISKKKKKKMRRQVNNELSKIFERMDLGLLGSRASSVNSDSDLDLLKKFECLGIKTEDSQEL
jgi:S-adenosylmethionine:diacylglycerol 3-amino-3-carboxypropyl transferase